MINVDSDLNQPVSQEFIAIGAYAGVTGNISANSLADKNQKVFPLTDGIIKMVGPVETLENYGRYMKKNWQIYPIEHEKAVNFFLETDFDSYPIPDKINGNITVNKNSTKNARLAIQRRLREEHEGAAEVQSNVGLRHDFTENPTVRPSELPSRNSGNSALNAALGKLDPKNDSHWTSGGKPSIDAVSKFYGANVTRVMIDSNAPDFRRGVL